MKNVLLTGFEPFGDERLNPSAEIARLLHGEVVAGHPVRGVLLPCVFNASLRELRRELDRGEPALVVCLGQAGGRGAITPERLAVNVDDARIPDNAGRQPVDRPVVRGGPAAYWSTLPIKAIVRRLALRGIPAEVSQSAGTFVCNHVFYALMHALRGRRAVRAGFIHVPWLPGQGRPHLTLEQMTDGIRLALEVSLTRKRDLRRAGGSEA
ncbi:MAG: pyroglutamyl-peptidase I [Opitutales bacterium]